jgi:hypothetical protein
MRALGLLVLLLVAASAGAQSIKYSPRSMPNEVTCGDFFGSGYFQCDAPPIGLSFQREVVVAPQSGTSYGQSFFKVNGIVTDWQSGGSTHPSILNGMDIVLVNRAAETAPVTSAIIGLYTISFDQGTGGAGTTSQGAQFYAYSMSSDATHPVDLDGVYAFAGSYGSEAIGRISGVRGEALGRSGVAIASYIEAVGAGGPPTLAECGTDASKCFKVRTTGFGRNYFMQPASADGDTLYAAEVENGKGLLVSGSAGQLQLAKASGGAKPTCASGTRGSFWYEPSGAGVKDTVEVCAKDAGDAYAWRTIY